MKAIVVHEFGEPEVLRYEDAPDPKIGAGEVLVRVRAVGVNFADHLMRRGTYRGQEPPLIPGLELAGEVVMVGPGVSGLSVGQRVFGWARDTYAELAAVPATKLLPIPEHLSFEQAAAVPTVFGTAWACLSCLAKLQPGERVLVHAAGSGVGTAAIQVAKALGAWVVTTAGDDWKLDRARELGADETINYKTAGQALAAEVARLTNGDGVQIVLEGVGRATFAASMQVLSPMGRMVIYGSPSGARVELDTRLAIFKNLTIYGLAITTEPRTQETIDDFRTGALPLFEQQRLSPVIHQVLPFSQAAEAHRILLERGQFGKLVLTTSTD
jgi:NADPH:quinone reductase